MIFKTSVRRAVPGKILEIFLVFFLFRKTQRRQLLQSKEVTVAYRTIPWSVSDMLHTYILKESEKQDEGTSGNILLRWCYNQLLYHSCSESTTSGLSGVSGGLGVGMRSGVQLNSFKHLPHGFLECRQGKYYFKCWRVQPIPWGKVGSVWSLVGFRLCRGI